MRNYLLQKKYHISRMQALLDDLGSANSMYREMYDTSKNSAGSATRENEIYMKSLEARIALTRVEVEKLAVSIGNAFLTDGMISFLQLASGGLGVITKLVDGIGLLPIVLGTTGMAAFALSTKFRTLSASVGSTIISLSGYRGAAIASTTATNILTAATRTLSVAWKGFLASLGVGIPLIIVGVAIEKLMSKMGDARQRTEELESQTKQMFDSYKTNKKSIDELVVKYTELENAMKNGDSSKSTLQEHVEVADELGKLMPSLVRSEDTYGRNVVGSSDAVKIRVEMLQRQLEIQEKIALAEAREQRDENIDTYKDSINKSQKELDFYVDMLEQATTAESLFAKQMSIPSEKRIKFVDDKGNSVYRTFNDVEKGITKVNEAIKEASENGDEDAVKYYSKVGDILKKVYQDASPLANDIIKNTESLRLVYSDSINDIINSNSELDESVKESAKNISLQLLNAVKESDLDNVKNGLENLFSGVQFSETSSNLIKVFSDLENASEESFDKMKKNAEDFLSNLPSVLKSGGMKPDDIKAVMKVFETLLSDVSNEHSKLTEEAKKTGKSIDEVRASAQGASEGMDEFSESTGQVSESLKKQIEKLKELSSASEQIVGVSEAQTKAVSDSITVIEFLGNVAERTEEQELSLANSLELLSVLYPQVANLLNGTSKQREQAIKIIESENQANRALLKATELAANGKMNAEGRATMAHLEETNRRIKNINAEIRALDTLQANYNKMINSMSENENVRNDSSSLHLEKASSQAYDRTQFKQAELATLADTQSGYANSLLNTVSSIEKLDKSQKGNTKTAKEANKTTKESIWITDEYKRKLDELNLAIAEQERIQSSEPEHAEKYRKSLEEQVKLEQQKLQLMKDQAASIDKQIKSGKIQQTGSVDTKKTSTTTSQSKDIGAFGSKITSGYGNRVLNGVSEFHRGVDFGAKKGTSIMSPVSGKVIKAGDALSKTNGKKMSGTYGNLVVIQDDSGMKHIMAHMDTVVAKFGDYIQAGTKVGTVGKTGNSTGNHLHYEQNTADGKLVNPMNTVNALRKNGITMTSGGYATSNSTQDIDGAIADLNSLNNEMLNQEKHLEELQQRVVDRVLAGYEFRKSNYDKFLENSDNRLKKLSQSSQLYRDELDKQANALNSKKSINQAEIDKLNEMLTNTGLSTKLVNEYTNRLHELGKVNSEIDFALTDIDNSKLESYVSLVDEVASKYDTLRKEKDAFIEYETLTLQELDTSSLRYLQSLEKINKALREKQNINRQELTDTQKLIISGELQAEALENAKNKVVELNAEIKKQQLDIQEKDYEIIVSIKTNSDAVISDIQSEINRNEAIRKMYEEGSADYKKYTDDILKQYEKMAKQHLATRDALVEELKQRDITAQRIKDVKKLLEEEHLAYLNATISIKDYTKQLEKANETQLKDIAEKLINAYKEYVQERKDEHMKSIDEEIKRENEKHEKIMKQLNEEMDLFRKNVEEKLRLIDRQEAERDYNMQINDMEKERDKLQSEYNLLLLDNSNEAKSKRKKLQEQLDKIDKDINEKRHERDIELQKQGLNDLLETKEDEINGKIELQDKEHENIIKKINREKEYWEKHYTDLLNDERKFARIREDILAGHFDKVMIEFEGYIEEMKATMPDLADTMDGTMQAVGMSIRQNVIDHLQEAINKINEFNATQISSNTSFGEFNTGEIFKENAGGNIGTSKGNLTQGDLKVLLGKFLTDNVANSLSGTAKTEAHSAGNSYGGAGRAEGSTIDKNISFDNAIKGLTSSELEMLKQYFETNKSAYGGRYSSYINNFLNGKSSPTNSSDLSGTGKYGLSESLTNGDMQVLMAKYVNENLLGQIQDTKLRSSVKSTADKMASDGRNYGMSKLDRSISFGAITSLMSRSQANQLKSFMNSSSGIFGDSNLQNLIRKYAASLDTGGFMNWSGLGMDGKGGKAIIAHPNEIMLDKVDTKGFFNSIDVMDKLMNSIRPMLSKFAIQPIQSNSSSNGDVFQIQFGDVIEATKDQAESFATSFINNVKTKKGGRL